MVKTSSILNCLVNNKHFAIYTFSQVRLKHWKFDWCKIFDKFHVCATFQAKNGTTLLRSKQGLKNPTSLYVVANPQQNADTSARVGSRLSSAQPGNFVDQDFLVSAIFSSSFLGIVLDISIYLDYSDLWGLFYRLSLTLTPESDALAKQWHFWKHITLRCQPASNQKTLESLSKTIFFVEGFMNPLNLFSPSSSVIGQKGLDPHFSPERDEALFFWVSCLALFRRGCVNYSDYRG